MRRIYISLILITNQVNAQNCECNKWEKQVYSNGNINYDYTHGCSQPGREYRFVGYDAAHCEKLKQSDKAFKKYQSDYKAKTAIKTYQGYSIKEYDVFGNPSLGVKTVGKNREIVAWTWDFFEQPHKNLGACLKGTTNENGKAYGIWFFKSPMLPIPESTNWLSEFKRKGVIKEEITMFGLRDVERDMSEAYGQKYEVYFNNEYRMGENLIIPLSLMEHLLPHAIEEKKEFVRTPQLAIPSNLKNGMWVVFKDAIAIEAYDFDPSNPKNQAKYAAARQAIEERAKQNLIDAARKDSIQAAVLVEKRAKEIADSLKMLEKMRLEQENRVKQQRYIEKYWATNYDLSKTDTAEFNRILNYEFSILNNLFDTLTSLLIMQLPQLTKEKNVIANNKVEFAGLSFNVSNDLQSSISYTDKSEWKITSEFIPKEEKTKQFTSLPLLKLIIDNKSLFYMLNNATRDYLDYLISSKYTFVDSIKVSNISCIYGEKLTALKAGVLKIKKTNKGFRYENGPLSPELEKNFKEFVDQLEAGRYTIKYHSLLVQDLMQNDHFKIIGKEK